MESSHSRYSDKWRACPLWSETARLLRELLAERTAVTQPTAPVFTSRQGGPLTRYGIYKLVRRHAAHLTSSANGGPPRRISPHVLRHTTAVHLLEAGVEINVIRGWQLRPASAAWCPTFSERRPRVQLYPGGETACSQGNASWNALMTSSAASLCISAGC
jgi:hypothetical protein